MTTGAARCRRLKALNINSSLRENPTWEDASVAEDKLNLLNQSTQAHSRCPCSFPRPWRNRQYWGPSLTRSCLPSISPEANRHTGLPAQAQMHAPETIFFGFWKQFSAKFSSWSTLSSGSWGLVPAQWRLWVGGCEQRAWWKGPKSA